MKSGYALHPKALEDLEAIRNYIAQDNPDAALKTIHEVFDTLRSLVTFPYQGHLRPDLTTRPLRFTLVGNYLVAYAPEKRPLWVLAVIHGRRSPRVVAAILRRRK